MRTLEGITVVSVEQAVAAPFASRHLADLGARVIKVERPSGDFARHYDSTVKGLSSHFVWTNRNKESLVLDLKDAQQIASLQSILREADVFIQNLAPGAAQRLGLGHAELHAINPRLITCSISGYGESGPYEAKKAYDLLVQCETGVVSITGTEEEPAKAGIPVADIAAGMYAFSGILAALVKREKTGEGSHVDVSMLEALGEWMGYPMYYTEYGGTSPRRTGARHAAIAPYGPFAVAGGTSVFLAVQNDREWSALVTNVLRQPELLEDPRFTTNTDRVEHAEELKATIEAVFEATPAEDVERRLDDAGIANARLRTPKDFVDHPQLAARERWMQVGTSKGPIKALKPVFHIDEEPPRTDPVPDLGQHTERILLEYSALRSDYSALEKEGQR
ncbi:CoA transferase [Micrococcus luteus]|nr:CoA transferase [Micrococcus luteus]MCV7636612.1 CoA transferase [Micrococcus luteus]MCV7683532.1 CoA transferase [Micrococcus luteus]MDK7177924.1 CaiB/BaiF CoA-transferase family protein [Micrococcus luteus]